MSEKLGPPESVALQNISSPITRAWLRVIQTASWFKTYREMKDPEAGLLRKKVAKDGQPEITDNPIEDYLRALSKIVNRE